MLSLLETHLSPDIAKLIRDEFLGRNTLSIPILEVHSAYKVGFFQILEICETLQHPFVQPCFLGYLDSGEPNESLVDMLLRKGVYDVEMIPNTLRDRQMISIHSIPYFMNPKYEMFNTWQKESWHMWIYEDVDCATEWNLLLTSECIREATCHLRGMSWHSEFAIQRGATQCYACQRTPRAHLRGYQQQSRFLRIVDNVLHFGDYFGPFTWPRILRWTWPCLIMSPTISLGRWIRYRSFIRSDLWIIIGGGLAYQLGVMIGYGIGNAFARMKIKCRNPHLRCWKNHWIFI